MSTTIERQVDLKPAAFEEAGYYLTRGQRAIIALMNTCIQENRVLTRQDIIRTWIQCNCREGQWYKYQTTEPYLDANGNLGRRWVFRERLADVNGSAERFKALPWFRNNIGSCVLKGGLLAIPVIEPLP